MLTCYIYSNIWLFSTQKMTFIKHTYPKVDKSNLILTALGLSTFFYAWMGIFLTHWKNFVLYSLSCYWYFSSSKESLNGFKLLRRCLKDSILHTGTIAFGSFIMLVVTTIRKMLEEAAKNAKDNNSGVMYFFSCCIQMCWSIFETWMEFLTKHAYIETAIHGTQLSDSAQNSLAIVNSNFMNLGTIMGLCDLLLFTQSLITGLSITILFKFVYWNLIHGFRVKISDWTLIVSLMFLSDKCVNNWLDCVHYFIHVLSLFHEYIQ